MLSGKKLKFISYEIFNNDLSLPDEKDLSLKILTEKTYCGKGKA